MINVTALPGVTIRFNIQAFTITELAGSYRWKPWIEISEKIKTYSSAVTFDINEDRQLNSSGVCRVTEGLAGI